MLKLSMYHLQVNCTMVWLSIIMQIKEIKSIDSAPKKNKDEYNKRYSFTKPKSEKGNKWRVNRYCNKEVGNPLWSNKTVQTIFVYFKIPLLEIVQHKSIVFLQEEKVIVKRCFNFLCFYLFIFVPSYWLFQKSSYFLTMHLHRAWIIRNTEPYYHYEWYYYNKMVMKYHKM